MHNLITPLILCGGSGTRLWPASRSTRPKQFLPLLGDFSPFQQAVERVRASDLFRRPVILTNESHRYLVADQLRAINADAEILLEPEGRDSGPAIGVGAAFVSRAAGGDAIILSLAADHVVRDAQGFRSACRAGRAGAEAGYIVTFGVTPSEPAVDYGYIECGAPLPEGCNRVQRFVEKPDAETARRYLREHYLWNSGNFLFKAQVLLEEYQASEPATHRAIQAALDRAKTAGGCIHIDSYEFAQAEKRSIDYAVMERTARAAVVPANFDWSDIGSWAAVHALSGQDEAGNATRGGATFLNARNNFVSTDGPHVAVVGLDNVSVIATGDAIMVARLSDTAGVKATVARLQAVQPSLTREHPQCFRPWGHYRSLQRGPRHQVKHIAVKPGGQLSLQKHHHRSEHWVVIRGTARVTVGDRVSIMHENESIYIPIGAIHRLENPGKIELEIIEVQTGSYLGEDDIIRVEDIYDRLAS